MEFPSKIFDNNINIGPEKRANHATNVKGFNSLLKGLTKTWPNAQIPDPNIVSKIPKNLPSKLGEPVKIYTPIKAINIPIKLLIVGFSLSIKYANKTPNGTSVCTNKTAAEASIKFNPL